MTEKRRRRKKWRKRLKRIKKRRRELDLGYGGQKMKLLVMSSYLLDLVRSFQPVPDAADPQDRTSGLLKVVKDYMSGSIPRSNVESTYGPIADWDTSRVTKMDHALGHAFSFDYKTFNADISKWDVSNVETMSYSTFQFMFFLLILNDVTSLSLSLSLSSKLFPLFLLPFF